MHLLSEGNQSQKATYCMIPLVGHSRGSMVACGGRGGATGGGTEALQRADCPVWPQGSTHMVVGFGKPTEQPLVCIC